MSVYLFFDRLQNGEKRLERYIYNDGSSTVGDWVEKMCALYAGGVWFPAGLTGETCTLTCQNGANINLKVGVSILESKNGNPLTVAVRRLRVPRGQREGERTAVSSDTAIPRIGGI